MEGIKNLVVGYDGSKLAELALRRTLGWAAESTFALVHVVVVARETPSGDVQLPRGPLLPRLTALHFLRLTLQRQTREWGLERSHVRPIVHLRQGSPSRILVDLGYRYSADLLAIGAHGDAALPSSLGQVAREVLDEAHELNVHVESLSSLGRRSRRFDEGSGELGTSLRPPQPSSWVPPPARELPS